MQLQPKMLQRTRIKVFRITQITNKAPSKILGNFEIGKKAYLVFPKPKNKTKG